MNTTIPFLLPMVLAAIQAAALPAAAAGEFVQQPHSFPEYNERFTRDALTPVLKPGLVLHVSVSKGADTNPGSTAAPFKTLTAARDAIRALKKSKGLPDGGIEIRIHPGMYRPGKTLQLTAADSGTKESPIVWRGVKREEVIFSGGVSLNAGSLVTLDSPEALERLHPKARGKVMGMDLSSGDTEAIFGPKGRYGQLSMDGHLLNLAQWPNRGYHHIGRFIDKGPSTRMLKPGEKPMPYSEDNPTGGKFAFQEKLPPAVAEEFAITKDIRAQGYFHNDWFWQNEALGAIDGDVIQLLRYTRYGILNKINGMPRRIRLVNVLAELDEPGEWYFDRQLKGLYLWPTPSFDRTRSTLTIPGGPTLLELNGTEHLTFREVTFENTGALAISIKGGHHNLIAGCTIRNGTQRGANVSGGHHNGLTGCEIHGLESAFSISGGNFKTLERCYNFATNNDIHSCRRRGYGMVGLNGVGIYFAHNRLRDMNGAVSFSSVDLLMEYNEFYNIGYEMGDFNVAYCGAQWWSMGNVLRYNFVHHLLEPGGHPVCPFRNDDGGAGLKIHGNVFYRPGRCAGQFAGPANDLTNNIALDMACFWWTNKRRIDPAGIQQGWDGLSKFGRDLPKGDKGDFIYIMERKIGEKAWTKSPWKDEFPELARFIEINPFAQTLCNVDRNYAHKVRELFHIHGGDGTVQGMESKETGRFRDLPKEGVFKYPQPIELSAFRDVKSLDFRFKPGFKPMANFKPIPFEKIGLVRSEFRPSPPDKQTYRRAVYNKFKDDKARRYDPKVVNSRYPVPSYLQ